MEYKSLRLSFGMTSTVPATKLHAVVPICDHVAMHLEILSQS
jgi:hypothetical protein